METQLEKCLALSIDWRALNGHSVTTFEKSGWASTALRLPVYSLM